MIDFASEEDREFHTGIPVINPKHPERIDSTLMQKPQQFEATEIAIGIIKDQRSAGMHGGPAHKSFAQRKFPGRQPLKVRKNAGALSRVQKKTATVGNGLETRAKFRRPRVNKPGERPGKFCEEVDHFVE